MKLFKDQRGMSHLVTVLAVLAIAIVGVVALRVSSASRLRSGYNFPSYGSPSYQQPTFPTYTQPARPTGTSGTSGSVCTANGHRITAPAGHSCGITSDSTGVHCLIDGAEVACES